MQMYNRLQAVFYVLQAPIRAMLPVKNTPINTQDINMF